MLAMQSYRDLSGSKIEEKWNPAEPSHERSWNVTRWAQEEAVKDHIGELQGDNAECICRYWERIVVKFQAIDQRVRKGCSDSHIDEYNCT
jgi:hypothetical protein